MKPTSTVQEKLNNLNHEIGTQDGLKDRLRASLDKSTYDVTIYYKTTGFCQRVARSQRFENLTLTIISFNALWIWIDVDYNHESTMMASHPIFIFVELFLCAFFSFEWCVRFGAFRRKCDGRKDGWFVFDSILVSMMVAEVTLLTLLTEIGVLDLGDSLGKASILRLLRLLRLTRIGKLMSYVPELMILLKGMVEGMRSVGLTMFLLALIIYVVAVAMTQLADGTQIGLDYFETVPASMYTLLIHGMVPDIAGVMEDMKKEWYIGLFFVLFVFFSTFTVLNMLIGILCQVVQTVKSVEKEQMDVEWFRSTLHQVIVTEIDANNDGMVSKTEFLLMVEKPKAAEALTAMGLDIVALVDYADILFGEEPDMQLTFGEFIQVLLQSRGTHPATQKDIRELQKFIKEVLAGGDGSLGGVSRKSQRGPAPEVHAYGVTSAPSYGMVPASTMASGIRSNEPSDADVILTGLQELRKRVDGLETLVTTSLESQPQLAHRMNLLEAHVLEVKENQRQLLDRLPPLDLVQRLADNMAGPAQPTFSAYPVRQSRLASPPSMTFRKTAPDRDTSTFKSLFCEGPTPRAPANVIRHGQQYYPN